MTFREKQDGGPAFPTDHDYGSHGRQTVEGMSLRDWFAGQALVGIISTDCSHAMNVNHRSELAYRIADAMIAARNE